MRERKSARESASKRKREREIAGLFVLAVELSYQLYRGVDIEKESERESRRACERERKRLAVEVSHHLYRGIDRDRKSESESVCAHKRERKRERPLRTCCRAVSSSVQEG